MCATTATSDISGSGDAPRVAHGTIRPVVRQILERHPGLTSAEVGRRAKAFNEAIAETSVANELRRNAVDREDRGKGTDLYRRDGDLWFLAGDSLPEKEAAATVMGSPPTSNGRAYNGAALTA